MSQIPSDPGTGRRSLSYDELIALFVAFLTLGSVLFWGLTRSGVNLFGSSGLFDADGAPSIVGDLDGGLQSLELPDAALDDDDNEIGFGAAEIVGAAGAGSVFGDISQSVEKGTQALTRESTASRQTETSPDTTVTAPTPPQQEAQPASSDKPEELQSAEEPTDAAANSLPPLPLEASREALKFQDVPEDYWAKPYIDALSERLVINGLTEDTFAPEEAVTRAQLASVIAEAFPVGDVEAAIAFSDVSADYWALDAIDKSVKGGFMNGFPDASFQPTLPVPRAQVLTALVTGLNAAMPDNGETIVGRYRDADQIPDWAVDKMAAATQSSIVVNYPNLDALQPNKPATRAEVAAMIYQTLVAQGRIEPIDGEYVVQP